jgi:hypothetical protein
MTESEKIEAKLSIPKKARVLPPANTKIYERKIRVSERFKSISSLFFNNPNMPKEPSNKQKIKLRIFSVLRIASLRLRKFVKKSDTAKLKKARVKNAKPQAENNLIRFMNTIYIRLNYLTTTLIRV